jgi:nucleoside 2-deoxyribosyltransferase
MDEVITQETDLSTFPKPFIFVVMPFDKSFIDVYELGILSASIEAGAFAERLDKQIYTENMLQRIYHQISTADLIIADMTGQNPNVFYEVGYAHALDKKVILITKNVNDIPFDFKHYPHIVYENVTTLKTELKKWISFLLKTSKKTKTFPINVSLMQQDLKEHYHGEYLSIGEFEKPLKITVQNRSETTQVFKLGIVQSKLNFCESIKIASVYKRHFLEESHEIVYLIDEKFELYPNCPHTIYTDMIYKDKKLMSQNADSLIVRIFTENGDRDFTFPINLESDIVLNKSIGSYDKQ